MKLISDLLKEGKEHELLLIVIFIVYLLTGYKVPDFLAGVIDTTAGKVTVALLFASLFMCCHPVLAVIGLIVAYELIRRSAFTTGSDALKKYMPSEEKKATQLNAMNQFPYTLEQEMVKKMAPPKHSDSDEKSHFTPNLEQQHDAAPLDYKGVI